MRHYRQTKKELRFRSAIPAIFGFMITRDKCVCRWFELQEMRQVRCGLPTGNMLPIVLLCQGKQLKTFTCALLNCRVRKNFYLNHRSILGRMIGHPMDNSYFSRKRTLTYLS